MADQAQAELYLRLRAAGIGEASRELKGLAATAVSAGREFRVLQEEAGAGLYRKIRAEAQQATAELTRVQRVAREGRAAVLMQDVGAALGKTLAPVGRVGSAAFGALTAGIGGFVTAGMQGTAESLNLHRALQQINYDVASIFTPTIHRGIDAVQRLSDRLRGLTGVQQASARQWAAGALAVSGFMAVIGGRGLPGVGRLPLVGGLLGGPGGIALAAAASSEEGRKSLADLATATAPLVKSFTALIPAVVQLARAIAWVVSHLPGSGGGGSLGQTALAAGGVVGAGAVYGGLKIGTGAMAAAGGTFLGGALTGGIASIVGLAVFKGISDAVADRVENQTDVAELKRRLAEVRAGRAAVREKFGGELTLHGEDLENRIRARIKDLEGPGKPKEALTPFAPGFESPADLYRRIAEVASADTSKSAAEQTADNTKQMADALRAIREAVAKLGLNAPLDRPGDD